MSRKLTVRERYQNYAARHPKPLPYKVWLQFREWGGIGGRLSDNDKSAAGKAGAAAKKKLLEST